MIFQVTVRHGSPRPRYHTLAVEAPDAVAALRAAADAIPAEVAASADLVEVREAVNPDARSYLGEG